jgi:hypothetical protein
VDNEQRDECDKCGWIRCKCGACGCGYQNESTGNQDPAAKKQPAEVRETAGLEAGCMEAAKKCQRKIKRAFERLTELSQVDDEETVIRFFQQTLEDVKNEFGETIYFFDLLWLVASEIKELMNAKKENAIMAGISRRLRNEWIRFAPGDIFTSGKAFWDMNSDDWIKIRNHE